MNIKGCRAIVTGGGSGYGKGIAAALVQAGASVWITGRRKDRLETSAEEIGARSVVADVTRGADWDRLFAEVGQVDVLVNNAGFGGRIVPVSEQTDDDMTDVLATNLLGAMMGSARAARVMKGKGRGAIVNVASVCACHAWPGWSVYTAAKAGLLKFSHGLFTEMRPHGVRVTCLIPSWGQTEFNSASGIVGASEDPALSAQCMSGAQMGRIVLDVLSLPDNLVVPEMRIQPMVQEIVPM